MMSHGGIGKEMAAMACHGHLTSGSDGWVSGGDEWHGDGRDAGGSHEGGWKAAGWRDNADKRGGGPGGGHWQQHTMVKTVEGDGWSKILALSSSIRLVICH